MSCLFFDYQTYGASTLPEISIFLWSIAVSRAKSSSKKRAHPKKEVLEHVQKQSSRTQKQTEKYK